MAAKKTTKKVTVPKKKKPRLRKSGPAKDENKGDLKQVALESIVEVATSVYSTASAGDLPTITMPQRNLGNVTYSKETGYFELGDNFKTRTLDVNSVKTFAQSLRLMSLAQDMVGDDDFATKREAYYVSKNWGAAKFNEQRESDTVLDDMEGMFSLKGVTRETLRFVPEEHGGSVVGALTVIDRDPETLEPIRSDCAAMGSGAYTVPSSVDHLGFETTAEFVLAIETGGMFQRLNHHRYWRTANCILVEMGGVPTRATRRFVRRLSEDLKLPVYAFVDCDPYGICNIYRTLKVGSGASAHINAKFCVPNATYLGVTPQDIEDFGLQDATHPLLPVDIKRAKDALKNDPFFQAHPKWKKALKHMLKLGVRAEQQAFAKWGLNFVIEEYLPVKMKQIKQFLP
ncbi:MAG: DNA topoisomerase IV subunit A [Planctomycetes bacterium]|jgi:DNA topoisomerase-6 subunit A|nr:DNA topoisomerase IV subunit A [Planctomycetota bacterium]MBT4028039.1 DNA topoisomerase IV subunit A [Planctomycetota bacterium]MBT4561071.1 DNA topoisomerase IV subunit A [Planctomycetota bacterium]MBT5102077.1 DNA topoisomerase IV subunit A [Planctomycetota bacterium]MBT7011377.1 DNA topoisomerase IV subunit A [Planctomycetota bacterium]